LRRDAYHRALVAEQGEGQHAWLDRWGYDDDWDRCGGEELARYGTPDLRVRVYFIRQWEESWHSIELEEWDYDARRWSVVQRSPKLAPHELRWNLEATARVLLRRALDPVAAALADAHPGTCPELEL
jgi:hypothetical protein